MASLLSSNQTLSQIQNLANASSAKIGRVTLSRSSSRNVLPTELKCSAKSSTKPLNVNAVKPSRPLERTRSQWQIELAPKPTKPKALVDQNTNGPTDGGFLFEVGYLFMTTLEVVFFGPYDTVTAAIDVPAK